MRDSTQHWQAILAAGFSSSNELLQFLQLPTLPGSEVAEKSFKTRVPRGFAERMQVGNRQDPLLLQVLADPEELTLNTDFETDPLQEAETNLIPGLIHKYASRVLLTVTGVCPINCRYCFRRHFPYQDNNPGRQGWQKALDYIAANPSIHEVILSGGEPLMATDTLLGFLLTEIRAIKHVTTLRVHTRIPIVLPERIQSPLLSLLQDQRVKTVIVTHCNHPNELSPDVENACRALRDAGCCLLNQSVLLKEVNNDANVLAALSERLFSFGVLPYYLHLLDKVKGAHHFDVPLSEAQRIYRELQAMLPGYLVPKMVREIAGEKNKTLCALS